MLHNSPASTVDPTYVGLFWCAHALSSVPDIFQICGAAGQDVLATASFDPESDSTMTEYSCTMVRSTLFMWPHEYVVAALVILAEVFYNIDVANGLFANPGVPLEFIQGYAKDVACPWRARGVPVACMWGMHTVKYSDPKFHAVSIFGHVYVQSAGKCLDPAASVRTTCRRPKTVFCPPVAMPVASAARYHK